MDQCAPDEGAQHGSRLLAKVSRRREEAGIKGCSTSRLKPYRQFDQQHRVIGPTLSDQLAPLASDARTSPIDPTPSCRFVRLLATLSCPLEEVIALFAGRFTLGWSYYVTLLTIDRAEERAFYKVEVAQNQIEDSRRLRYQRHRWRGTLQWCSEVLRKKIERYLKMMGY